MKYDPSGEPLWVRHASGPDGSTGVGPAIDSAGNCFITGEFWSTLTFDQTTPAASSGSVDNRGPGAWRWPAWRVNLQS